MSRFQRIYVGSIRQGCLHIIDNFKPESYEGKNCLSSYHSGDKLTIGWAQKKESAALDCSYYDLTDEDLRILAKLLQMNGGNNEVKEWVKELILWWINK